MKATDARKLADNYYDDSDNIFSEIAELASAGEYETQAYLSDLTRTILLKKGYVITKINNYNSLNYYKISW